MQGENYPNVSEVRAKARQAWEKQARKNISLVDRIGEKISWAIVIVAVVFFVLSAPHTVQVFGLLTPVVGFIAPVGIECTQLFLSFWRKLSRANKRTVPFGFLALEGLVFVAAIIVNGAGSFMAVVDSDALRDMSIGQLATQFGALPAKNQVALLLVPFAALIIPIGASISGESMAVLFMERREKGSSLLDERWEQARADVEYEALRDAAIANGITPKDAIRWASQIVGANVSSKRPERKVQAYQPSSTGRPVDRRSEQVVRTANASSGYTKRMDARSVIREYLSNHPESASMSLSQIVDAIEEETGVKVGRSSVHNVLNESPVEQVNFSSNGHGKK
jgi:hypothetical protein